MKSGAWIGESWLNVRAGFILRYSMCGAFRFNLCAGLPYLCRGGVYPRPKVMAVRFCSHALQREETMSEIAYMSGKTLFGYSMVKTLLRTIGFGSDVWRNWREFCGRG